MNTVEYTPAQPEIKGQGFTRRDALASIGALALAASSTAALASTVNEPSELRRLIEAHRMADLDAVSACEAADEVRAKAIERLSASPIRVRLRGSHVRELHIDAVSDCSSHLAYAQAAKEIERVARVRAYDPSLDLQAELAKIMEWEAQNLALLAEADRQRDALVDCDYDALAQRKADAIRGEKQARTALLSYRVQTMAEVRELADYLISDGCYQHSLPGELEIGLLFASLSTEGVNPYA